MSVRPTASFSAIPLKPIELMEYTRFIAAEVMAGGYPFIRYDEEQRWHQRIYRDQRVDVWLISWMPEQGTQLHDHGGSSGSFTVIRGCLSEAIYRRSAGPGEALVEQSRAAGSSVRFGARYVHDVRNLSSEPALSVHAYSAPLSAMTYYDVDDAGLLQPLARVLTDDPEAIPTLVLPGKVSAA